jgi:hypothetical protein
LPEIAPESCYEDPHLRIFMYFSGFTGTCRP